MIRIEGDAAGHMGVMGDLNCHTVAVLREAVARGVFVLDLSAVVAADEEAVAFLASLDVSRCHLASTPAWLELWIERLRLENSAAS